MNVLVFVALNLVLFGLGLTLAFLGSSSYTKETCQAEPSLPVSMVISGSSLLIVTAVTCATYLFNKLVLKTGSCCMSQSKSVVTIIWAFCCGLFAIFWLLVWIGIWISLSYYTVVTIQRIGIAPQDTTECDATVITVSVATLLIVWIVFIGLCCLAGFAAFKNKTKSSERRQINSTLQRHSKENIYDSVPQENIF